MGVGAPLAIGAPADRASLTCLAERCSRPHRSPARVPAEEAIRICELRAHTGWSPRRLADEPAVGRSHSTAHRVLQRGGCSRRPRPERPAVVRYLWPCPGQLLHMDTKKLGKFTAPGHAVTGDRRHRSRRVGWEYVHSIVDDCSRLAYSEIHDDEQARTVTAFTERALDFFADHGIVAERLMTDNAPRPYPDTAHVVSALLDSDPEEAGTLGAERRAHPYQRSPHTREEQERRF